MKTLFTVLSFDYKQFALKNIVERTTLGVVSISMHVISPFWRGWGGGGGGGCTFEIKRGLVLHFWKDIMKIEEKQ